MALNGTNGLIDAAFRNGNFSVLSVRDADIP